MGACGESCLTSRKSGVQVPHRPPFQVVLIQRFNEDTSFVLRFACMLYFCSCNNSATSMAHLVTLRSQFVSDIPRRKVARCASMPSGAAFPQRKSKAFLRRAICFICFRRRGCRPIMGACEAVIGSLKSRAHHKLARNDRPGEWTCDNVEAARVMANEAAARRTPCAHAE